MNILKVKSRVFWTLHQSANELILSRFTEKRIIGLSKCRSCEESTVSLPRRWSFMLPTWWVMATDPRIISLSICTCSRTSVQKVFLSSSTNRKKNLDSYQCSESGSGSTGSTCFFLPPGSGSTRRKILNPTILWLFFYFLSLKNDVNVPSKSNN